MSAHRAHRRVRPPRPAVTGSAVLAGAAVLGLGVGSAVAAPSAHPTAPAASAAPSTSALPTAGAAAADDVTGHDVLWYGLLTTAAVAGAAGAHQLSSPRSRRRA